MTKRAVIDLRKILAELLLEALARQENADPQVDKLRGSAIATLDRYFDLASPSDPSVPHAALPNYESLDERLLIDAPTNAPAKNAERRVQLREEFLPFFVFARERTGRYLKVLSETAIIARRAPPALDRAVATGATLFNVGLFFETHEVLEAAWRNESGEAKSLLQGLVQIAVAFHHFEEGNLSGARSLLDKGRGKLARATAVGIDAANLDIGRLLGETDSWAVLLASEASVPPSGERPAVPRLRFSV